MAGQPSGAVSFSALRGKSAISISISGGFNSTSTGNNRYTDFGSFTISKSGGGSITSYAWGLNDYGGELSFIQGANSSNYSMRGRSYSYFNSNPTHTVVIGCTVVIDGVSRYVERSFTYTGDGGA